MMAGKFIFYLFIFFVVRTGLLRGYWDSLKSLAYRGIVSSFFILPLDFFFYSMFGSQIKLHSL